jgi:hypothetical protein
MSSFVVFEARAHLNDLTPQAFAEKVVSLFGGKDVMVVETKWIGQAQNHLRVCLDKPQAEEIGISFWHTSRSKKVKFSLAPCRVPLLREAITRMRRVVQILRDEKPELRCRRVSATCSSFLGSDLFCAYDFLYSSLTLSDGSSVPISQLISSADAQF